MKLFLSLLLTSIVATTYAQIQGVDFYSYRMNNMININPAYTNANDGINIYTSGLAQGRGVANSTKTFTVGIYSRISEKQGLGGGLITDSRGAFGTTKAWLSYAYTAKFNEDTRIHFGVNAGAISTNLKQNRIEGYSYLDLTDPTLDPNYYNRTQFVAGLGALFQWKKLDVSVSLPHLIMTNNDLLSYVSAYTQYKYETKKNFDIIPGFMFQRIPNLGNVYSGYVQGTYKNTVWLKGGYQSTKNIYGMLGFNVENIQIGYSYRINTGLFTTVSNGSHELSVSIKIGKQSKKNFFNPTLHEIDSRLNKLNRKSITAENKEEVVAEVKRIRDLMKNTEINESTPEAAQEVSELLKQIENKLITLQNKINAI